MTTDQGANIVPDFGDDEETRKIAFVCSKGSLDMAYPALVMASGALEHGIETHIFFTFWGMDMINKKTMGNLHFSPRWQPRDPHACCACAAARHAGNGNQTDEEDA